MHIPTSLMTTGFFFPAANGDQRPVLHSEAQTLLRYTTTDTHHTAHAHMRNERLQGWNACELEEIDPCASKRCSRLWGEGHYRFFVPDFLTRFYGLFATFGRRFFPAISISLSPLLNIYCCVVSGSTRLLPAASTHRVCLSYRVLCISVSHCSTHAFCCPLFAARVCVSRFCLDEGINHITISFSYCYICRELPLYFALAFVSLSLSVLCSVFLFRWF